MSSLLDLISPFIIALLMTLTGYMVALVGNWIKRTIVVPVICMILFDSLVIFMYYFLGTSKLQMITGVMFGIILKIIIYILYQKYLSDE